MKRNVRNQSTDSTGGSIGSNVGWEKGPECERKIVLFNP